MNDHEKKPHGLEIPTGRASDPLARAWLTAVLSVIEGEEARELSSTMQHATYGHVVDWRRVCLALEELGVRFPEDVREALK